MQFIPACVTQSAIMNYYEFQFYKLDWAFVHFSYFGRVLGHLKIDLKIYHHMNNADIQWRLYLLGHYEPENIKTDITTWSN